MLRSADVGGLSMARYFSYREITSQQLPSVKDISWVAGQISALPPFISGSAILCGSVAWGTHSARSDIDIAHFGTTKHPQIEREILEAIERYQERTRNQFIAVDIITIGVEPEARPATTSSHSITDEATKTAGASIGGDFVKNQKRPTIFPDTFVRFADHIGSLAHAKAGSWKTFLETYLSPQHEDYRSIQCEAIRSYVSMTTAAWEEQPLHHLNLGAGDELTQGQLDLIGQAENYPVNLMRRILGALGVYPRPDRAADVRAASWWVNSSLWSDPRPPSPAFALHHAAHRQESAGCAPRAIKARMARTDGLRLPAAGVLYACTACLSMRARVTLMRRRGVRLPDREISSARTFEGNLTAAYLRQCFYATLHDPMRQVGGPIIPDLYDAVLVGVGNDALLLRGIERIPTAEGGLGVVQEWRCEILGG